MLFGLTIEMRLSAYFFTYVVYLEFEPRARRIIPARLSAIQERQNREKAGASLEGVKEKGMTKKEWCAYVAAKQKQRADNIARYYMQAMWRFASSKYQLSHARVSAPSPQPSPSPLST